LTAAPFVCQSIRICPGKEKDLATVATPDLNGRVYKNDTIWYGLVQGFEEEWGYFSQAEIESLKPRTWEIKKVDLPYSGRRR